MPHVILHFFATFFFAAPHDEPTSEVLIDDGEITEHEWMRPVDAMARRDGGEIELAPPTWMTLHRLSGFLEAALYFPAHIFKHVLIALRLPLVEYLDQGAPYH